MKGLDLIMFETFLNATHWLKHIRHPPTNLGYVYLVYLTSYHVHKLIHCVDLSDIEIYQGDPNTNSSETFS